MKLFRRLLKLWSADRKENEPDSFKHFARDTGETKLAAWSILQKRLLFQEYNKFAFNAALFIISLLFAYEYFRRHLPL